MRRSSTLAHLSAPQGVCPSDGYSHVVTGSGRLVVLAGQMPFDASGALVGAGDPAAQARQVLENLTACLTAAGATLAHVVKLGWYVVDMAHLPVFLAVRDEFIDIARPPASTVVQVVALFRPDLLLELDGFAILPE